MQSEKSVTLELKLTNGTRVIRTFYLSRVYNLIGRTRRKLKINKKFPFFHFECEDYITFRYQDTFNSTRDMSDSRFSALISLSAFIAAFGINFTSYEELLIKSAITGN